MKKGAVLAAFLSVIFSWSSLAGAKSFDMGFELGASIPNGDLADISGEGLAWGVFSSIWITPHAAMQFSFLKHDHDLDVVEPNDTVASIGEQALKDFATISNADISMKEFVLNGKYAFTEGRIIPYVIAGGGVYLWDVTVNGNQSGVTVSESTGTEPDGGNSDTTVTNQIGDEISRDSSFVDFGLNAGLGISFLVTGEISFGVEAMYSYVFGDFDEGFATVTGIVSYGF